MPKFKRQPQVNHQKNPAKEENNLVLQVSDNEPEDLLPEEEPLLPLPLDIGTNKFHGRMSSLLGNLSFSDDGGASIDQYIPQLETFHQRSVFRNQLIAIDFRLIADNQGEMIWDYQVPMLELLHLLGVQVAIVGVANRERFVSALSGTTISDQSGGGSLRRVINDENIIVDNNEDLDQVAQQRGFTYIQISPENSSVDMFQEIIQNSVFLHYLDESKLSETHHQFLINAYKTNASYRNKMDKRLLTLYRDFDGDEDALDSSLHKDDIDTFEEYYEVLRGGNLHLTEASIWKHYEEARAGVVTSEETRKLMFLDYLLWQGEGLHPDDYEEFFLNSHKREVDKSYPDLGKMIGELGGKEQFREWIMKTEMDTVYDALGKKFLSQVVSS